MSQAVMSHAVMADAPAVSAGSSFYPAARTPVQGFDAATDRARLSGVALVAFRALVARWQLSNAQAACLLGVSDSTWDRIKRGGRDQPLSQDHLTRASAAIGIFKALHLLFAPDAQGSMADRWPGLPNRGPLYQGRTPVEAMMEGGIPTMLETRRLLDAVRGGL